MLHIFNIANDDRLPAVRFNPTDMRYFLEITITMFNHKWSNIYFIQLNKWAKHRYYIALWYNN